MTSNLSQAFPSDAGGPLFSFPGRKEAPQLLHRTLKISPAPPTHILSPRTATPCLSTLHLFLNNTSVSQGLLKCWVLPRTFPTWVQQTHNSRHLSKICWAAWAQTQTQTSSPCLVHNPPPQPMPVSTQLNLNDAKRHLPQEALCKTTVIPPAH